MTIGKGSSVDKGREGGGAASALSLKASNLLPFPSVYTKRENSSPSLFLMRSISLVASRRSPEKRVIEGSVGMNLGKALLTWEKLQPSSSPWPRKSTKRRVSWRHFSKRSGDERSIVPSTETPNGMRGEELSGEGEEEEEARRRAPVSPLGSSTGDSKGARGAGAGEEEEEG